MSRPSSIRVIVIIDLTPIRDSTGPVRRLDLVEARSRHVLKTWLGQRDTPTRAAVDAATARTLAEAGAQGWSLPLAQAISVNVPANRGQPATSTHYSNRCAI